VACPLHAGISPSAADSSYIPIIVRDRVLFWNGVFACSGAEFAAARFSAAADDLEAWEGWGGGCAWGSIIFAADGALAAAGYSIAKAAVLASLREPGALYGVGAVARINAGKGRCSVSRWGPRALAAG
jgi:hypothetical protein